MKTFSVKANSKVTYKSQQPVASDYRQFGGFGNKKY